MKETSLTLSQIIHHNLEWEPQWLVNWSFSEREAKQFKLELWTFHTGYHIQPDETVPDNRLTLEKKNRFTEEKIG